MNNITKAVGIQTMIFAVVAILFVGTTVSAADLGGYSDDWYDDSGYSDGWYSDSGYSDGWYSDAGYSDSWYNEPSYFEESNEYPYAFEESYEYPYAYEYDYDYGYDYSPSYSYDYGSYDYGCGSYCGTGGGSYGGCGSYCGSYTTPGCTSCGGYSTPRYTAPSSSYSNVVTNTNTNVNNVTNIDNSIRDSFNNYNSGNTSIVVSAPQTPVYTQPAPYCTITHAQYGGYGSGSYLSWSATNASSAYISQIGNVALSGSQMVYGSGTYTMTVYGYNGQQATCATYVQGTTYNPPVYQQPYVSLTQIPYTGFDFGTFGNAMYWAALASFAIAGAYLMVYYRGGALAFATAMVPARRQKFAPVVAPMAPILVEKQALAAQAEVKVQPIVAALRKAAGTIDSMAIVQTKDGSMPKIVIQRA